MIYPTQEQALQRAVKVAEATGRWPGVYRCPGGWRLTWEPEVMPG